MSQSSAFAAADPIRVPRPRRDHVTTVLRTLRERAGLSREQLAHLAGYRGPSSIQRYEEQKHYKRDYLDPSVVERLRAVLVGRGLPMITDADVDALGFCIQRDSRVTVLADSARSRNTAHIIAERANGRVLPDAPGGASIRRIPVYGQSIGGEFDEIELTKVHVREVMAPPALVGIPDVYAIQVSGDSMEPRYRPGELVFVDPTAAIRHDDYVVAQVAGDGEVIKAYVKRFVAMTQQEVMLKQLSPEEFISLPRERVLSIHRIVMAGDG